MDFYHNKLNAATILIRLQLLFYILLQLHICLRGSESGAIAAGNPNQEMDTYLVILSGSSVLHYDGSIPNFSIPPLRPDGRPDMLSASAQRYATFLGDRHDLLLQRINAVSARRRNGPAQAINITKLYSFHYLINGFAAQLTTEQAAELRRFPDVISIEKDRRVIRKFTTYTPTYMGLPTGAWADNGGVDYAGEGVVIGLVDTGIYPSHPSFSDTLPGARPYRKPAHFTGGCEVTDDFPPGSCNAKLVGARHFARALKASGLFDSRFDSESPLDGDGHGTHTASTAAGNSRVPVVIDGMNFGLASGIAPRAHIAIYKSMFRNVGGYFSDTVAAMDQAVQDGVDILSLSIGPAEPPSGLATFFSAMEIAALSAVRAGVFVVQAAGNSGPAPGSVASYSPWIFTVGAAYHNRVYHNHIHLRHPDGHRSIRGFGLSPATDGDRFYELITARDAAKVHVAAPELSTCQEEGRLERRLVEGKILVCSYGAEFVSGAATIRSVLATANRLSARGVILTVDAESVDGPDVGPFPSPLPALLIPSLHDSMDLLAYYYNLSRGSVNGDDFPPPAARIMGGLDATFSKRAAQVASYSSRGPDLANDRRDVAEIMKPDVMAPGDMIWAAWSPNGNDDDNFAGASFALSSGTSMAAPHVAGAAALLKQKNPALTPSEIASALTTTATSSDEHGNPLLAQRPSTNLSLTLGPATPFDFGGGEVNPTLAMDPGLVFHAGFRDYVDFLCSLQGSAIEVLKTTGTPCETTLYPKTTHMSDLNKPSITIANLTAPRTIRRIAKRLYDGNHMSHTNSHTNSHHPNGELYTVIIQEPDGVRVSVKPSKFKVGPHSCSWWRRTLWLCPRSIDDKVELFVTLIPISRGPRPSFGNIILSGNHGHKVRIPVSIIS